MDREREGTLVEGKFCLCMQKDWYIMSLITAGIYSHYVKRGVDEMGLKTHYSPRN